MQQNWGQLGRSERSHMGSQQRLPFFKLAASSLLITCTRMWYLWTGEALVPGGLKVGVSLCLLVVLLDQVCCLGAVVDAMQQAGIQDSILSIGPADTRNVNFTYFPLWY